MKHYYNPMNEYRYEQLYGPKDKETIQAERGYKLTCYLLVFLVVINWLTIGYILYDLLGS